MKRERVVAMVLGLLSPALAWAAPDGNFGLGTGKNGPFPSPSPGPTISINEHTRLFSNASGSIITIVDDINAGSFNGPTTVGGGDGDLILLWQPGALSPIPNTDAAISAANVASSGVGKRELARITAKSAPAGGAISLTVTTAECNTSPCVAVGLTNTFDSTKTSVVLVKEYTLVNVPAGISIVPKRAWERTGVNALTGGIVAFLSQGAVTLGANANISAEGFGFVGGATPVIADSSGKNDCSSKDCLPSGTNPEGQQKGEGIGGDTHAATALNACFGAPANGGGGGVCMRTGGGGGGNGGAGGKGGSGTDTGPNPDVTNTNGGSGGRALPFTDGSNPISLSAKLIMGGGGGAGHSTGAGASGGQRGGGVIFIRAASVNGPSTARINAGGGTASTTNGTDGQGGGGGGGSIYIRTTGATSTMCDSAALIRARGSAGVNSTNNNAGAGGGGGGGRILVQSPQADCQSNTSILGGSAGTGGESGSIDGINGSREGASGNDPLQDTDLTSAYCSDDPGAVATASCSSPPLCDHDLNRCVQCRTAQGDADCPVDNPECQADHTCGNCLPDTGSNPSASASCTRFAADNPPKTHCEEDNNQGNKDGQCVECLVSSHCPNAKPVCDLTDTSTGDTCGPCTADNQCTGQTGPTGTARPPKCHTVLLGGIGECVQCLTHSDCNSTPATPSCDPVSHACVRCDNAAFADDAGCTGGLQCHRAGEVGAVANEGRCVACSAVLQADANVQCDDSAAAPSCSSTNECGACTNLSANTGCDGHTSTPLCETDNTQGKLGQCVECLDDTPCSVAATPICLNDVCTACQSAGGSAACETKLATAPFCDTVNGDCESCASNDAKCNVDAANRPACQSNGSCNECSGTNITLCDETEPVCNTGTGLCGVCDDNTDCTSRFPAKPVCEVTTGLVGQCVACRNGVDTDCTTSDKARCVTNGCADCNDDAQCNNGVHGANVHCETNDLTGDCVVCRSSNNSVDCPALDPVCSSHVCVGCTDNAQCTRFGATFECDQTTGGPGSGDPGDCVGCTDDSQCEAASAPNCVNRSCTDCVDDNDCTFHADAGADDSGQKPACQPGGLSSFVGECKECSIDNTSLCTGNRPACLYALGICQLCTVGVGDLGANSVGCAGQAIGNACQGSSTNVFCGCTDDANCGAETSNRLTSGRICNTVSHLCVNGCSRAPGRNNCDAAQDLFCTSNDVTGAVTGVCTTTCNFDVDCQTSMPTMPYCVAPDGDAGTGRCAGCRNDGDCTTALPVCQEMNKVCVECTASRLEACSSAGKGAACLADETCGCTSDADCGGATSGRICDLATTQKCVTGCRAVGGNGCPAGQVCNGAGLVPGQCVVPFDMAVSLVDMAVQVEPDLSVPADLNPAPANLTLSGGGLGCSLGGAASAPSGALYLFAALGLWLGTRRRARRR